MSATWKTEYGTRKARTPDPDEAIDILLGEALDAVPELSQAQFDKALRRLKGSWGDQKLVNETPDQIAPVLRHNARRFSGESGFRGFEIALLEPPSYKDEEAAQIDANFAHHAIAARVWKTKDGVHVFGDGVFQEPGTSVRVSGAQWLKKATSRVTGAGALPEGTVQVRNRLGFGDGASLLVEEKPDLERIFADPDPKPPQALTDLNRDYWAEQTPAYIRSALVSAYLEHSQAEVRAETLRMVGNEANAQQLADLLADRAKSVRAAVVDVIWDRSPGPAPGISTLGSIVRILYDEVKAPSRLTAEQARDALQLLRDARPDRIDDFGKWLVNAWVYEEESLAERGYQLLDLYAQHGTFRDAAEEPAGQLGAEIEQVGGSQAVQAIYEAVELVFGEDAAGELAWAWRRLPLPDDAWDKLASFGEEAVESLSRALREGGAPARRKVVESLGKIGDVRAVDALVEALEDKDYILRRKAVVALGRIGDARVMDPLARALKDTHHAVRRSAVVALGKLGTPEAVDLLCEALKDQDPNVRMSAANALDKIGDPRSAVDLVQALGDEDFGARVAINSALAKVVDATAVAALVKAAQDEREKVRGKALEILGEIDDERAVPDLIQALGHRISDVRRQAAFALGRIGDARAVEPLKAALQDDSKWVREAAKNALESMSAPPASVGAGPPVRQPADARPYPSPGRAATPLPQRTVARQTAAVNLLAVLSLVLGILSVPMTCFAVLGLLLGVGALLCGFFGLRQVNLSDGKQKGKGIAIAGLVLGGCGLILSLVMGLLSLMLPTLMSSGQ